MNRTAILQVALGVLAGLLLDYVMGNVIISSIMAAAIASFRASTLKEAAARGIVSGLAWVTIAFLVIGVTVPGAFAMVSLTASIAGMPLVLAYLIVYLLVVVASVSTAAIVYRGGG